MLRTDNIAWRKFCSLFVNIVKKGKGRDTQNCPNTGFSHNFCHWLSEKSSKFWVWYFSVAHFRSNWRDVSTHYATIIKVLIIFKTQTSSLNTWVSDTKSLFFRFFSSKTKFQHWKQDCTRCTIVHQIVALITYIPNLCNCTEIPRNKTLS